MWLTDRRFAMKVLPPTVPREPGEAGRPHPETAAISELGHENIVFVTNSGDHPDIGQFYVMEYLNGQTLAMLLLGDGTIGIDRVLKIASHVGAGLAAAHDVGFVHEVVNPRNLMSHRDGENETWKVLDFGFPLLTTTKNSGPPEGAERMYLAPEQQRGTSATPAADQFGLAATLLRALGGSPPHQTSDSFHSLELPETAELDSRREQLREVFSRALSPDPSQRYRHVDDFVSELHRAASRSRPPIASRTDVYDGTHTAEEPATATTLPMSAEAAPPALGKELSTGSSGSLEVSITDLSSLRPTFTMTFFSARRLRREWRKNLIGAAALVPTDRRLAKDSPVFLVLEYLPTHQSARFPGRVSARVTYPVPAIAVEIAAECRDELYEFISNLQIAAIPPGATITQKAKQTRLLPLSKDELFVFGKLEVGTTIGEVRRRLANLPVPVDDTLTRLEEKKLIRIEGHGVPQRVPNEPSTPDDEAIERVIERAEFLRERGNNVGELELLSVASERYQSAELFRRLAIAVLQFKYDLPRAIGILERALEVDPADAETTKMLQSLRQFSSFEPNG